jgi:hypothetical protein
MSVSNRNSKGPSRARLGGFALPYWLQADGSALASCLGCRTVVRVFRAPPGRAFYRRYALFAKRPRRPPKPPLLLDLTDSERRTAGPILGISPGSAVFGAVYGGVHRCGRHK